MSWRSTGQCVLAPQPASALKPQSIVSNLLPAKQLDTSNEIRTTSRAFTDSAVQFTAADLRTVCCSAGTKCSDCRGGGGGSFLPHHSVGLCWMKSPADIAYLTLILLTWRTWWAPNSANSASRWQMGFNSAFKGLNDALWLKPVMTMSPIPSLPAPHTVLKLPAVRKREREREREREIERERRKYNRRVTETEKQCRSGQLFCLRRKSG